MSPADRAEGASPSVASATCTGPGPCDRPAVRRGLCAGHERQVRRRRPLTPLRARGQTPMSRLEAAALVYAEAESDRDITRARERLRAAAKAIWRVLEEPSE